MTEKELRKKVVDTAESYFGCKESDGSHKKIIDLYNSHKPLARGYAVKYTDAWCSTFASAVAIACGLTDIIPTECGCENTSNFSRLWALGLKMMPIFPDWGIMSFMIGRMAPIMPLRIIAEPLIMWAL